MPGLIHIIGDSHSSVFTGLHGVCGTIDEWHAQALPGFRVWHLGQYLAHSVATKKHEVQAHIRRCLRDVGPNDRVAFYFGEIDCRNHVAKHARNDDEIDLIAKGLAVSYVKRVRSLTRGRKVAFVTLPPPTEAQHGNMQLPTVGTFAQRARAVGMFNMAVHATARSVRADVIDIHETLATPAGEPNPAYFADGVHADPRALPLFLREFIRIKWLRRASFALVAAESLAMVQPCVDGREMLPGRLDDPRAARRILIERAALVCKAHGAKRIAIWGAGRHTQAMGLEAFRARGLRVVAILDDAKQPRGASMCGVPVVQSRVAPRVDAVVISSDAHEAILMERAAAVFRGTKTLIVPIYSWQS